MDKTVSSNNFILKRVRVDIKVINGGKGNFIVKLMIW